MKKPNPSYLLLIVLAVSGCSTVPVDTSQSISRPITDEPKEALNAATIIVLSEPSYSKEAKQITNEQHIETCIKNKILEHNSRQKIISFDKLAGKLFPNLPKKRVPRSSDDLSILLDDEKFYTDISAMGIRYVIFVGELSTEVGNYYAEGAGSGGILLWVWDKETQLSASILDIRLRNIRPKKVENTSTGTSWFLLVISPFPIPIGMPSFAVHNACSNVGNDIGKILLDKVTR